MNGPDEELTVDEAIAVAREQWGRVPFDKIEPGHEFYKGTLRILADEIEHLRAATDAAWVALIGKLDHPYQSCNEGCESKCFTCEGIAALADVRATASCTSPREVSS